VIAGTVASCLTYPAEFVKTSIQHQSIAVGFRGRRGIQSLTQDNSRVTIPSRSLDKYTPLEQEFQASILDLMPTSTVD